MADQGSLVTWPRASRGNTRPRKSASTWCRGTVYFKGRRLAPARTEPAECLSGCPSRNPTGRMATPQDIANASVFLASPASSFTTGSNLIVDGAISNR